MKQNWDGKDWNKFDIKDRLRFLYYCKQHNILTGCTGETCSEYLHRNKLCSHCFPISGQVTIGRLIEFQQENKVILLSEDNFRKQYKLIRWPIEIELINYLWNIVIKVISRLPLPPEEMIIEDSELKLSKLFDR